MSAKNLVSAGVAADEQALSKHSLGNGGTSKIDGSTVLNSGFARASEVDKHLLLRRISHRLLQMVRLTHASYPANLAPP